MMAQSVGEKYVTIREAVRSGSNVSEYSLPVGTVVFGRTRSLMEGEYTPFTFLKVYDDISGTVPCWQRNGSPQLLSLRVMSGFLRGAVYWEVLA